MIAVFRLWLCAVCFLVLLPGLVLTPVGAADAAFAELLAARRWEEAEANARARLAADANDRIAAKDLVHVIVTTGRRSLFGEAEKLLDRLVADEPAVARHHFNLGQVCGRLAQAAGLGGLGLARKSRQALARAVELEPRSFEFTYGLNEFFLDAPGIAGGSVGRARAAAVAFEKIDRDAGLLLQARVLAHEKKYTEALARIAAIGGREDALVNITRRSVATDIGFRLLDGGRAAEALPLFERITHEFPNNDLGHLGLGRSRWEAGDGAGAMAAFARCIEISGHPEAWYGLGRVQEASRLPAEARTSFQTALDRGLMGKNAVSARRRLAALGG